MITKMFCIMSYTEQDCIDSIQEAANELGESPSKRQYDDLDYSPHSSWIVRKIGSWNRAKELAGLEKLDNSSNNSNEVESVPENIEMSQEEWEELSSGQRFYRRHPEKHKEWVKEREKRVLNWFYEYKESFSCCECEEKRSPCLDFHHQGEKNLNVSQMPYQGYSKESIKQEIENCEVLCANCHRIKHSERYEL